MLGAREIKREVRNNSGDIWDGICTIPAVRDVLW
jgi:hypothetical protein